MKDPYSVLGIPSDSDDATIRQRYLELVREFPPERSPERFAEIREAYERLKDLPTRLSYRLFEAGKNDSVDAIIKELTCRMKTKRISLANLLAIHEQS